MTKGGRKPVKRAVLALLLALALPLTGCASLLERDYLALASYEPVSAGGGGSSSLRVETYQGLVNAILFLVAEGKEHGVLGLYNYTGDVEDDLTRACLEVVQEDPLGAYAVDYIKHDCSLIVTYYEADIDITYRRTPEQVASIVSVTGSGAIRRELRNTLTDFSAEAVLRVSYFTEDEDYILDLVRQAYYDAPAAALGMPEASVSLYPASGRQRIVEIGLTYPESPEVLRRRSQELKELAQALQPEEPTVQSLYDAALEAMAPGGTDALSTAYAALTGAGADSEGAALAFQLLCDTAGVECVIVHGRRGGAPHFWNIASDDGLEYRHVDLSAGISSADDLQMAEEQDCQWDRAEYPVCAAPEPEEEPAPDVSSPENA